MFAYVEPDEKEIIRQAAFKLGMSESAFAGCLLVPAARKMLNLSAAQAEQYRDRLLAAREG